MCVSEYFGDLHHVDMTFRCATPYVGATLSRNANFQKKKKKKKNDNAKNKTPKKEEKKWPEKMSVCVA